MGYVTGDWGDRRSARARPRAHEVFLAAVAAAVLVAKYPLLSTINVNWDEFMFLSRVHEFQRGELTTAFQTFHVQLFRWLAGVSGNEVDQVVAGRLVMYALRVGSSILVYLLALRVSTRAGALVAVLGTLTFSYVLRHGESFRADPLITFLFLLTATLVVWKEESRGAMALAGAAFALATSVSVKTAIYAPALAGVVATLAWSGGGRRARLGRAVLAAGVAAIAFGLLQLLHASAVSAPGAEVVQRAAATGAGMLGGSSGQPGVLWRTLRQDWGFWILCGAGTLLALVDAWRLRDDTRGRARALLLLSLLLPMLSLELYRNTFQYFYVTIVPLAALAVGYLVARIEWRVADGVGTQWRAAGNRPVWLRPLVVLLLASPMIVQGARHLRALGGDGTAAQRQVLDVVHEIFPQPVPYIDRAGMVASFPRVNRFMSTYVMAAYRRGGTPEIARIVRERQPRFLLANVLALELDKPWRVVAASGHRMLPEDFAFLQENFVHHWGPVWVPGVRVDPAAAQGGEVEVRIMVGGRYAVEGGGAVTIDGRPVSPTGIVELGAGVHRIRGDASAGSITLRLGGRLPRPAADPPAEALFHPL